MCQTFCNRGKSVSIFHLFKFATCLDYLLMFLGGFVAFLHGLVIPGSTLIISEIITLFVNQELSAISSAQVTSTVQNSQPINCTSVLALAEILRSMNSTQLIANIQASNCLTSEEFINELDTFMYILLGIAAATLLLGFLQVWLYSVSAERQIHKMRLAFFKAVLRQDMTWFDLTEISEFNSTLIYGLTQFQDIIGRKIGYVIELMTTFIAMIAVSFYFDWIIALVSLAFMPILIASILIFKKVIEKLSANEQKQYASAGGIAEEILSSIKTVVSFGGEDKDFQHYSQELDSAGHIGYVTGFVSGMGLGLNHLILFGTFALITWMGGYLVNEGLATSNNIVTVYFSLNIGMFFLFNAISNSQSLGSVLSSLAFVFGTIKSIPDIDIESEDGDILEDLQGDVEFEDVVFPYPKRPDVNILDSLSVKVKAGQTLALIGASGSGKSTVVQLLQRFYDVEEGSVLIDGHDIRSLNVKWLRSVIGVVSQEPILFDTTIYENIAFGCADATREEIERAAKEANIHDFISSLPEKYNTKVGERGAQMSGGQKQRIAIARALVGNPKILLLDEATSALDAESEKIVKEALDKACNGRTTIVIAHHMSTVRNADKIAFITSGKVAEYGSHDELFQLGGLYHSMVIAQTDDNIQEELNTYKVKRLTSATSFRRSATRSGGTRRRTLRRRPTRMQSIQEFQITFPEESTKPKPIKRQLTRMLTALAIVAPAEEIEVNDDISPDGEEILEPNEEENRLYDQQCKTVSLFTIFKDIKREWILIVLGLIGSILVGASFPLFSLVIGEATQIYVMIENFSDLQMWSGIVIAIGVAATVGSFMKAVFFKYAGDLQTKRLRKKTLQSMLKQDMDWFDRPHHTTGALSTRLALDASYVQGCFGPSFGVLVEVISNFTFAFIVATYYSWSLSLILTSFLPLFLLTQIFQVIVTKRISTQDKRDLEKSGKISYEVVSNIRTIDGLGLQETFYGQFKKQVLPVHRRALFRNPVILGISYSLFQTLLLISYIIVFRFGGFQAIQRTDSVIYSGLYNVIRVFFAFFFGTIFTTKVNIFATAYTQARLGANRIYTIIQSQPTIVTGDVKKLETEIREIDFSSVSFEYPSRPGAHVLRGLSLTVREGQTLALVGPSGSGKSTVVSLLERFYDPISPGGTVSFNDVDIRELNVKWLRSQIALVAQEPILFNASVADNIRYGVNDREVTEEETIEAAKSANIHNFIVSLPLGYDTIVGLKGGQMSGGQKQRIAIARALVRNPKVLLLDEPTSALDAESEKVVQEALDKIQETRTTIMISHKLSAVRNADSIAVIKDGKVAEIGTHSELLERRGVYYKLYTFQNE